MASQGRSTLATDTSRAEEFVQLQTKYQQRVFSFILTLVPHWSDAEEVLQETSLVLWRKFEDFRPGSDFVRWANQVAFFEILKYRKRCKRKMLCFSEIVLEELADEVNEMSDMLQDQRQRLADCLKKLPEKDRELVQLRYQEDGSAQRAAKKLGRTVDSVYKSLRRVRHLLLNCANRMVAAEERI